MNDKFKKDQEQYSMNNMEFQDISLIHSSQRSDLAASACIVVINSS